MAQKPVQTSLKPILLFLLFLCLHTSLFAGGDSTRTPSIKPAIDFDQRFSYIHDEGYNVWGMRGGILVNDRFKTGMGFYFMTTKEVQVNHVHGLPVQDAHLRMVYGTGYFEPFLIRKKYFELSLPFDLGFGSVHESLMNDRTGEFGPYQKKNIIPIGTSVSLSIIFPPFSGIRPFRWFGLNLMAGYRYCFYTDLSETPYDGAFWSISPAILFDRISDDVKYWKNKKKQRKLSRQGSY